MHALLTLRTVRHLWLSQVLWRLKYRRLRRSEEATRYDLVGQLRRKTAGLTRDPQFPVAALAAQLCSSALTRWHDGRLTLLHRERPFAGGDDWGLPRAQTRDRLWMAHLHGHRWLLDLANRNAPGGGEAPASGEDLRRFLADWIAVCRPGAPGFSEFAWNSYDIATRILCWTCLPRDAAYDEALLESLALQAAYLHEHLEWDLRANHLLRDAAGLACAGRFFRGLAAERWLETATALAAGQVDEQVLPDGGHFERSPMYHVHAMEDLLALSCLLRDAATLAKLTAAWGRMAEYLAWVRHPDGQLALFNDGGFNGACAPSGILGAGLSLKGPVVSARCRGGRHFADTGMVAWHGTPWTVFFDIGPIGPDYQPGHAHADTLTLETSFSGRRLFVDPGTYAYDDDARRRYDRSTAAHNTVCIDARDSSEVWHIFRVGRRAYAHHVSAGFDADGFTAGAAHDGYASLPGGPKHARTVSITNQRELRITDRVDGRGAHSLSGGWLLAPGWSAEAVPGGWRVLRDGQGVSVNVKGPAEMKLGLERRPYHPEYGLEIETVRLCWILESSRLPAEIATVVE